MKASILQASHHPRDRPVGNLEVGANEDALVGAAARLCNGLQLVDQALLDLFRFPSVERPQERMIVPLSMMGVRLSFAVWKGSVGVQSLWA